MRGDPSQNKRIKPEWRLDPKKTPSNSGDTAANSERSLQQEPHLNTTNDHSTILKNRNVTQKKLSKHKRPLENEDTGQISNKTAKTNGTEPKRDSIAATNALEGSQHFKNMTESQLPQTPICHSPYPTNSNRIQTPPPSLGRENQTPQNPRFSDTSPTIRRSDLRDIANTHSSVSVVSAMQTYHTDHNQERRCNIPLEADTTNVPTDHIGHTVAHPIDLSTDFNYKIIYFGELPEKLPEAVENTYLPFLDGYRLLKEPIGLPVYLNVLQKLFVDFLGADGTERCYWDEEDILQRYNSKKLQFKKKLEDMNISLDTIQYQEKYNFPGLSNFVDSVALDGSWSYLMVDRTLLLFAPFQEFLTVELESQLIKTVKVMVDGDEANHKDLEVEPTTTLEDIFRQFMGLKEGDNFDSSTPGHYMFNSLPKQPYDAEVEIGSHSKLTFFMDLQEISDPIPSRFQPLALNDIPQIYRKQKEVGHALFDKILQALGDRIFSFTTVKYCVATAGYTSLREQTKARMESFGLKIEDVWICNIRSGLPPAKEFQKQALEAAEANTNALFVMICDEAHWGINAGGVYEKMMNGEKDYTEKLSCCPNLVQVFVSATPYGLLTKNSRIAIPDKVVKWDEVEEKVEYAHVPTGNAYVGLNQFLAASSKLNWTGNSPIRCDSNFEALIAKGLSYVDALAGDYLLSICKAQVSKGSDFGQRWNLWESARNFTNKNDQRCFNAVLKYYIGETEEMEFVRNLSWPNTETDKIVHDLLDHSLVQGCMKVIRIAPGEDKNTGASNDRIAKGKFLDPIRRLLNRLTLHDFLLLGDFGQQTPMQMLTRPVYRKYWHTMQNGHICERKGCECVIFTPVEKKATCGTCKHIHKKFGSYSDLNGLPVMLVIVMKGRLGDTFPPSFTTLDMRVTKRNPNNTNLSSLVQELGRLCFHNSDPIGRWNRSVLVSSPLLLKLKVSKTTHGFDYTQINIPVDYFVDTLKGDACLSTLQCSSPSQRSMDFENERKWANRILLWAEPQNGKTGAFIWMLLKLIEYVERSSLIVPMPDANALQLRKPQIDSFYPEWYYPVNSQQLGVTREYNKLHTGKYHTVIARKRLAWSTGTTVDAYKKCILEGEGPLSTAGFKRLRDLTLVDVNWDGFLGDTNPSLFVESKMPTILPSKEVRFSSLSASNTPSEGLIQKEMSSSEVHFELASGLIDVDNRKLKVSIPNKFIENEIFVKGRFHGDLKDYFVVLTPSYQVKNSHWLDQMDKEVHQSLDPDPSKCRLDYSKMLTGKKQIIQILLVRPSQYEKYREVWGNSHLVLKLPEKLKYSTPTPHLHGHEGKEYFVDKGGVGFARLVGQVWAYELGIPYCYMFDDNVIQCFEIELEQGLPKYQAVPFTRVMEHMEAVFTKDTLVLNELSPNNRYAILI